MNANDLIVNVQRENASNWKNSDIPAEGEKLLIAIAEHWLSCEDCANEFDLQGGFNNGTLQDFMVEYCNTTYSDWCCS